MLDDISGVKKWEKVNQGMLKMYRAEVLGKLPIMQHFLFGSLLPFNGNAPESQYSSGEEDECGHTHVYAKGQEPPPCCGIRVPSAFGAKTKAAPLRKLPFD
jgi:serine/threonine-protein phosphatase 2A activator